MNDCLSVRWQRSAAAALSAALFVFSVGGCASQTTSSTITDEVEPFATRPHFKLDWREALNPPTAWEYKPREYATPHYLEHADEMYVGTDDGWVYKMRAGSGEILWNTRVDGAIHGGPVYGDDRVYVGTLEGNFYALDEEDGDIEWTADTGGSIESKPAFAEGRVFFTTSNDILYAADAATGDLLWQHEREAPEFFTIKETGAPVAEEGVVYCGFADGQMVALQLDTGNTIWESDLTGGRTELIDADEAPIVAGGRLYAAAYDGGIYALDRESGQSIWRQPLDGIADFELGEQELYVASSNGRIIAFSSEDGEPLWSFRFDEQTPVGIAATSLYLFVSTSQGPLYTLDRQTGYPLMTWEPSTGFNTPVVIGESHAFAFSNRGYLYGFRVAY